MSKHAGKVIPIAVFDISSASIAGGHVLLSKNSEKKIASVLASSRVYSEPREDIDIERFVSDTLKSIENTINILKKADNHTPKHLQITLSSPWFVSQTRKIVFNKTTHFICSQKLVDELIEKEISFMMEHDMSRFGSMGKEGMVIEKQISEIKLNGYTTDKPFGKKVQNMEVSLSVTVSPKAIINSFKDLFKKNYGSIDINFTTTPYASYITIRDFIDSKKEMMIVDVGEETTDVAYIKNEVFLYQQSFPIGFYELNRKLSSENHGKIEETKALLQGFKLGKLSAQTTSNIQKTMDSFAESWGKAFIEHVSSSSFLLKIPEDIYIISAEPFSSFLASFIKQDSFLSHSSGRSIEPKILNYELVKDYVSSLDQEVLDENIAIGSIFANRLL